MSTNMLMTRFGKAFVAKRLCCTRPVSVVRNKCVSRRRLTLRYAAEDAVEPVARTDVIDNETARNGSIADWGSVTFKVTRHVEWGQSVTLVGGDELLGNWEPEVAIPLTWMEGDIWTVDLELPAGPFEYKYLVKDTDGTLLEWYPGENLSADVTSDGISIQNEWIIPVAEPVAEEAEPAAEGMNEAPVAEEVDNPVVETAETSEQEYAGVVKAEEPSTTTEELTTTVGEAVKEKELEKYEEIVGESEFVSEVESEVETETSAAVEAVLESDAITEVEEPATEEEDETFTSFWKTK